MDAPSIKHPQMPKRSEGFNVREEWALMSRGALEVKDRQDMDFAPHLPLFHWEMLKWLPDTLWWMFKDCFGLELHSAIYKICCKL